MNGTAERRIRQASALATWLLLAAIVHATLSPASLRPGMGSVTIERFGAYAVTGFAFAVAYPRHWPLVLLGLLAAAGALEALQNLVPFRHGRVSDMLVKSSGAACGTSFGILGSLALSHLAGGGPRRGLATAQRRSS